MVLEKKKVQIVLILMVMLPLAGCTTMNEKSHEKSDVLTQEYVEKIVQEARTKFNIPAIAVTVMDSKKINIKTIQGTRIAGTDNAATLNDYFHIGSCSKSVLAVIAAKLIEEGMISWETKFFDIYPELKDAAKPAYYDITLEDLFLCKAGIMPYTSGEEFPDISSTEANKRVVFIKYLLAQPPASKREKSGTFEHLYSNAGYTMASAMLEKITGKSYEALIESYIVNGMDLDVYIGWPNRYNENQPWGHTVKGSKTETFPPGHEYRLPHLLTPAGDLSMSTLTFAEYIQNNLKGLRGEDNYITAKNYQYIHFGHEVFSLGAGNGKIEGASFSGLDGSAGTFFCRAILIPDLDFAFTIMMNAGSGEGEMKAVEWLTIKIIKKQYNWWWMFWA
jgi:D-alanyl-D-alanine carboxypeptidase